MDFDVKLGKKDLAKVEEADVHVAAIVTRRLAYCDLPTGKDHQPLDNLLDQLRRKGFLCLVMTGHLLKDFGFPAPIFNFNLS